MWLVDTEIPRYVSSRRVAASKQVPTYVPTLHTTPPLQSVCIYVRYVRRYRGDRRGRSQPHSAERQQEAYLLVRAESVGCAALGGVVVL